MHLIKAHKKSYEMIKRYFPEAQVGIAKHQVVFEIARPTVYNTVLQKIAHYCWNRWLLNRIRHHQDFIGLNHYNRNVIDGGFNRNPNKRVTDFGWEFYPESLHRAIVELKPYRKPIYITENGLADASDTLRKLFIPTAIEAVHRAIYANGADVRGYLYWSLLDNFELDKGFWLRFGLVRVDYATQKRTLRQSALDYAKVCESNALERETCVTMTTRR
jgi:beta-glucosidase/6-phospho-beta-glucosidase/beta-galactosidase